MNIGFVLTGALVYLVFVFILASRAKEYRIKSLWVFLIALFLTPLAGLIALMLSEKGHLVTLQRYACERCGMEHTENHGYCPHCKKEGHEIKLKPVKHKSL